MENAFKIASIIIYLREKETLSPVESAAMGFAASRFRSQEYYQKIQSYLFYA